MAKRGNNEGSIFKKKNGSWRAQVTVDGRRLSYTAKSRAECHDWLRRTLDQIDEGMTFQGRNLTLGEYIDDWMSAKRNTVRAKTAHQYESLIVLYIKPYLGKIKLKDLNLRVLSRFYDRLLRKGVGKSNIRYTHRVLHAALEQAVKNGIIGRNPAHGATVPKPKRKEMQILNEQQVGQFLVAASTSRYKALYHLDLTTGMRSSELRGLTWSDVDWIRGTISIRRQIQDIPGQGALTGSPKTDSGIRTIMLGETTLNELKSQRQRNEIERAMAGNSWQENNLIFPSSIGTPFSKTDLQRDFWKVLSMANLPRIRFHDLRHTAASLMLIHGIPPLVVSKILGHSNPSVTLTIYAHSTLDMQADAVRIMDEIVTPIPVDVSALHPVAPAAKTTKN